MTTHVRSLAIPSSPRIAVRVYLPGQSAPGYLTLEGRLGAQPEYMSRRDARRAVLCYRSQLSAHQRVLLEVGYSYE